MKKTYYLPLQMACSWADRQDPSLAQWWNRDALELTRGKFELLGKFGSGFSLHNDRYWLLKLTSRSCSLLARSKLTIMFRMMSHIQILLTPHSVQVICCTSRSGSVYSSPNYFHLLMSELLTVSSAHSFTSTLGEYIFYVWALVFHFSELQLVPATL